MPPGHVAGIADAVAVHRPALVYLIPSFHNPTGLLLPARERTDLVELARRHPDVTFIDDMSMADLAFADEPQPPPLAALAPRLPNVVTGGLSIWARLPGDADSSAFAQAALRRGVAVIPGRLLSVSARRSPWLRLVFVRPPGELAAAVEILAAIDPDAQRFLLLSQINDRRPGLTSSPGRTPGRIAPTATTRKLATR